MPNLGLQGAYGGKALWDDIQKMVEERQVAEKLEQDRQDAIANREYRQQMAKIAAGHLTVAERNARTQELEAQARLLPKPEGPPPVRDVDVEIPGTPGTPATRGWWGLGATAGTPATPARKEKQYRNPLTGEIFSRVDLGPTPPPKPENLTGSEAWIEKQNKRRLAAGLPILTDAQELAEMKRFTEATTREPQPPASLEMVVPVERPDGSVVYELRSRSVGQVVGRAGPEARATGEQTKTRDFYTRMRNALEDMDAVEGQLSVKDIAIIQNGSVLPESINNLLLSSAGQQYNQALRSYTLAKLRRESGAAISAGEFQKEGLVAARALGDTPQTLAQKKRTREGVAEGFAASSGKAYEDYYGTPFQRQTPPAVETPAAGAGGRGGPPPLPAGTLPGVRRTDAVQPYTGETRQLPNGTWLGKNPNGRVVELTRLPDGTFTIK